jgi:hypothetical protein
VIDESSIFQSRGIESEVPNTTRLREAFENPNIKRIPFREDSNKGAADLV